MEDEDFFSDDDFADIPDNALQAIEQHALVSTQSARATSLAPSAANGWPSSSNARKRPHNAASLNRPGSSNLPWRPPQSGAHVPRASQFVRHMSDSNSHVISVPSQSNTLDEEEVIDLNKHSIAVPLLPQTAQGLHAASTRSRQRDVLDPDTAAAYAAADAEIEEQHYGTFPRRPEIQIDSSDVAALQARIAALEANQERLQRAEQEARALAQAKQGEIQIVRSKLDTSAKAFESQVAALQLQHRDEVARQKAELEASRREREQMETDHRFLQHDLARETERMKQSNGNSRARSVAAINHGRVQTPKKNRRLVNGMGDGFDDAEMHTTSPSRSRDRSADQTPKAGLKRKRTAADSPVPIALGQTQSRPAPSTEERVQLTTSFETMAAPDDVLQPDEKFEYYRTLWSHRPFENHERTLEAFAKIPFPAQPEKSFASVFNDAVVMHTATGVEDCARLIATTLLDFWSACLEAKHFKPFYLVLELLRFVLNEQPSYITFGVLEKAIPLCVASIDLIAVETARESLYGSASATDLEKPSRTADVDDLETDEVVEFLGHLCATAALDPDHCQLFWRQMELDFIMILLQPSQPLLYITTMLRMLRSSALATSFAMITADPRKQHANEGMLLNKLTTLLFEAPVAPEDEPPYTLLEETELRTEILEVFSSMCCAGDYGGRLLVQHRSVIGRLVRFLDAQVSRLYTIPPPLSSSPPEILDPTTADIVEEWAAQRRTYAAVAQTVNATVRLLYHLLRTYDGEVDVKARLRVVLGGYHKFLGCLSRLAFTEQLVFERGVEDGTAEAAHAILDRVLGADECEAVMRAVETPRSGSGSAMVMRGLRERSTNEEDEE